MCKCKPINLKIQGKLIISQFKKFTKIDCRSNTKQTRKTGTIIKDILFKRSEPDGITADFYLIFKR